MSPTVPLLRRLAPVRIGPLHGSGRRFGVAGNSAKSHRQLDPDGLPRPKAVRFARVERIEAGESSRSRWKKSRDWPAGITKTFGQDLRRAAVRSRADSVLAIGKKACSTAGITRSTCCRSRNTTACCR